MTTVTQTAANGAPNCWQCRHFAVSWDPKLPYTCKLMGFKSRNIPMLEVLRADGRPCNGFVAKSTAEQGANRQPTRGSFA
jgi:hypothetical protein